MEEKEAVAGVGEDLFAIALDQPFRFPASFTFVLRAFTTLEGFGRTLDPDYKFAAVAQPYALELLQLQVFPLLFPSICSAHLIFWLQSFHGGTPVRSGCGLHGLEQSLSFK